MGSRAHICNDNTEHMRQFFEKERARYQKRKRHVQKQKSLQDQNITSAVLHMRINGSCVHATKWRIAVLFTLYPSPLNFCSACFLATKPALIWKASNPMQTMENTSHTVSIDSLRQLLPFQCNHTRRGSLPKHDKTFGPQTQYPPHWC